MGVEPLPLKIVRYPAPSLRLKCESIEVFDDGLAALAERMLKVMRDGQGVGLAGPQVGLSRRIFVCNPTGKPEDDGVFINPELSDLTGSAEAEEGCLCLPEVRVMMRRAKRCRLKALDVSGKPIEALGEDLIARIWQHETDHLNGRLIIDNMSTTDQITNKKAITQLEADHRKSRKRAAR